jgi:hypothetical protein
VSQAPLDTKSTAAVSEAYPTSHESSPQPATNSNNVLMGALAAAGLAASDSLAATTLQGDLHSSVSSLATVAYHSQAFAPVALDAASGSPFTDLMSSHIDVQGLVGAQSSVLHAPTFGEAQAMRLDPGHEVASQLPAQFLQGTQAPAHDGGALSSVMPAGIVMPSAQQLAGLNNGGVTGIAQHNQVVSQVLVDALHGGGGQGATIDAMINSLPHGGGANDSLASLASHGGNAVSNGDMGGFAMFTAAAMGLGMEHAAMVHQDVAPLHA